jgi:hypothetical protein
MEKVYLKVERTKKSLGRRDYNEFCSLLADWAKAEEESMRAAKVASNIKKEIMKALGKKEVIYLSYREAVWFVTNQVTETPELVSNKKILKGIGIDNFLEIAKVGVASLRDLVGEKFEKYVASINKSDSWLQILPMDEDGKILKKEKVFGI